jgi:hypothetical protein
MRIWTVDEANAALERVHAVVERVRDLMTEARERAANVAGNGHAGTNGHREGGPLDTQVQALLAELDRDGIVLRDVERGLVDFHAVAPSGRDYWLCWIVDEPEVAWWHWPEDGFAGRQPLTKPPA